MTLATPTATIFLPYHALDDVLQRGLRAAQPAAGDVVPGTLYSVIDEGGRIEQSDGSAWALYGTATSRSSTLVNYTYSAATTEPPGPEQLRFNAGFPYTAVTKLWLRTVTADGQDVYLGLLIVSVGSTILVQDKNDHTMYARFTVVGAPIDKGAYVEFPVVWRAQGVALGGGQLVLVQHTAGATSHGGTIGIVFDGGGSVITPGVKGFFEVGVTCTITAVTLLSTDAAVTGGSIVVDIWKDTYANYAPTLADTITASAKPTLSSATKSRDTTLTGWTTAIAAGDILAFVVESATAVTKVNLTLTVQLG